MFKIERESPAPRGLGRFAASVFGLLHQRPQRFRRRKTPTPEYTGQFKLFEISDEVRAKIPDRPTTSGERDVRIVNEC